MAEVIYRYDLPFGITHASVYGNLIPSLNYDLHAQVLLDVSSDGSTWTNVASGYVHPPLTPIDISSILSGSHSAYVRARMYQEYDTSVDYRVAQFLRTDYRTFLGGGFAAPNVYEFRASSAPAPAPPTADAGVDKVVLDTVILDGSASYDPDGLVDSYEWTLQHRETPAYDRTAFGITPTVSALNPGFYDVILTVTDNDGLVDTDTMLLAVAGQCATFPPYTTPPTGAVHAYPNLVWPPNNKMVPVTLEGYVKDELSIARDGAGVGVSSAYLLIDGYKTFPLNLDGQGRFSLTVKMKAGKGAVYNVKLYAADTKPSADGGPNKGLVDSTFIRVEK